MSMESHRPKQSMMVGLRRKETSFVNTTCGRCSTGHIIVCPSCKNVVCTVCGGIFTCPECCPKKPSP
jgi:hypothetical protein